MDTKKINTMLIPPTHNCRSGGQFLPYEAHTPEQKWCGIWFHCVGCGSYYLIESDELKAQNAKFFDEWLCEFNSITRKKDREKFLKNHDMYKDYLAQGVNPWKDRFAKSA